MTNEVVTNERKVYLDFAPASIEITNYDELKKEVEAFSNRYTGLVFGRDDKKDAEEVRSRLIALHDALENERKEVKNVYNAPLKEFEKQIKVLTELIAKPLSEIREGLKTIENNEKDERETALKTLLEDELEPYGLLVESFEINPKWLNKGYWTAKLKPTAKLEAEIDKRIEDVLKEMARYETEVKLLTAFCEGANIEPAGWISQLEHRSAMEVIDLINLERERKKKLDEELAQKKKEHDEFIARQQQEAEESERFAQEQQTQQRTVSEFAQEFSASLKIYGTIEQLNELNEFIKAKGMRVEEINDKPQIHGDWSNEMVIDDLPY